MILSYFILGEDTKKLVYILLSGFFIELLRYNSAKNKLNKTAIKKDKQLNFFDIFKYMSNSQVTFEQILKENKHKIYRICRIYAANPIEPEDLFQEVVFQIWKSLPSFKGNSSIDTWVYRIALNVCLRSKIKLDKSNQKTTSYDAIHFTPVTETMDELKKRNFNI